MHTAMPTAPAPATTTAAPSSPDTTPNKAINDDSAAHKYAQTTAAVIAGVTPMLALIYFCPLVLVFRHAKRHPRAVNKVAGARVQVWAPMVYGFLVLSSLAEVALAAWLLLQFRFNGNAPNISVITGVRVLLFAGCWTLTTAGTYALLFLDPAWSRRPIASVGAQALWILATWAAWVVGAALLNRGAPQLFAGVGVGAGQEACAGVVYCGQVKTLFGESPGGFVGTGVLMRIFSRVL
ncbi:hypothetical protein CONPUDRAFT_120257 [Coniophora puteana RWD-64-598 SS2]|uniref:MARVEL domain-containing protein n=1 Tax=Coniophora puteana (strain RWD-64-598) TaxID=741705 RepID=A0A5M3MZI6_CONPW|nr:uncharacterized protein CONPUDRAFT_120257 [Coniophora puteana RWD-64-598 SS2]EIW84407.1 hypothetical protein CONPUDRAFT_120257 [Coniophora puteana RWD-64-598 SS2]